MHIHVCVMLKTQDSCYACEIVVNIMRTTSDVLPYFALPVLLILDLPLCLTVISQHAFIR